MNGAERRPYLTNGNELLGTGQFAEPPKDSMDYRRGYLCGIVRGDAHLNAYSSTRRGRALIDLEALARARRYLADTGVHTHEFDAINGIIRWPECPTDVWRKGFLAGIFDAEGSCSGGSLRIANTVPDIIDSVVSSLSRFGFTFAVEESQRSNGLRYVRLLGGICEQLRFFHTVDPAISRKRSIAGMAIKNKGRLKVVSVEDLGMELPMYDITTGTGDFIANGVVSHNCFARRTHEYLDLDAGLDFDSKIVVKVNAPEVLRKQLNSPRWEGQHIAMGTNVDPYQRVEGRYRLMPGILEALRDARNPFSILTKGTLVLRDLDLIRDAAELTDVSVNVSVGFADKAIWRQVEPGTPAPRAARRVSHAHRCGHWMRGSDGADPAVPHRFAKPARGNRVGHRRGGRAPRHPDRAPPASRSAGVVLRLASARAPGAGASLSPAVRAGFLRAQGLPAQRLSTGSRAGPALRRWCRASWRDPPRPGPAHRIGVRFEGSAVAGGLTQVTGAAGAAHPAVRREERAVECRRG
jgi:hypothetical protein